jgi:hypothetical protein
MYDDLVHAPEAAAVRYLLLGSPTLSRRAEPYIADDGVDWIGLETVSETMAGGEALLVRIARELWHAEKDVGLWEIPRRLDVSNFDRVLEALRMCRGWSPAPALPEPRGLVVHARPAVAS